MKILPSGIIAVASTLSSLDNLVAEDQQDGPKVETVMNNGPNEKRFDLLLLPEGYTEEQQKDWDKMADALVAGFQKYSVMKEYQPLFNVHKIWAPSDKKWAKENTGKETAFSVIHNKKTDSFSCDDYEKVREFRSKSKANLPCIVVNNATVRGLGNVGVVISQNSVTSFFHELGHGLGLSDEYTQNPWVGFNVCGSKDKIPWQELIDKKVKGIGVFKVTDNWFKGEEKDCLMNNASGELDYGILCTNGIILYLREKVGVIEDSAKDSPVEVAKGQLSGIELKLLSSRSYVPQVNAVYQTGTADEMDALHDELKGKKLAFDSFDKKYKKATVSTKKNMATITDKLPVGSHLIAVVAKDPNPAILMDPDKVTYDQRIYRVDITEKK
jgi:hypothetical protein